jgi:hypothetical protein
MHLVALDRATEKRTALAVLFFWANDGSLAKLSAVMRGFLCVCSVGGGLAWPALAQDTIYRCGREYTNTPKDPVHCERLAEQAITVISGVRPQGGESASRVPLIGGGQLTPGLRTKPDNLRTATEQQIERDQLARTVVVQELDRVRQQHSSLLGEYRQGDPVRSAAEAQSPQKYQERVAALKAAIERAERDIDSLQRELARRPLAARTPTP